MSSAWHRTTSPLRLTVTAQSSCCFCSPRNCSSFACSFQAVMTPTRRHAIMMQAPSSQPEQSAPPSSCAGSLTGPPQIGLRGHDTPKSASQTMILSEIEMAAATSRIITVVSCMAARKSSQNEGDGARSTRLTPYFCLRWMESLPVRPLFGLEPKPLAIDWTPPSSSSLALSLSVMSSSKTSLLNNIVPITVSCRSSSPNFRPSTDDSCFTNDEPLELCEPLEDGLFEKALRKSGSPRSGAAACPCTRASAEFARLTLAPAGCMLFWQVWCCLVHR
mmetsp:Transcript_91810/g.134194  ORF Transcript_91810/g.134194 Transcript_91810/m.134194 type:complete len:276 (-) Transcript_91810:66-893(-)